jgi:fumarylacetoacetate (FAA) hydrolase
MKLASLKGPRDGRLVVVSNDLAWCTDAGGIAPTLQAALDDWVHCEPGLRNLATGLAHDAVPKDRFRERDCAAPLPRAFQWLDGSAYVNHVELVRKARGADMPQSFWTDPLMYQGGSDTLAGAREPISLIDDSWGCDCEAEIAVIVDDVPMGVNAADAIDHIKLIMLVNDVSLRNLIPGEMTKGFGFLQSKPSSAFSPVAITPDQLGSHWRDGRVHLPLVTRINDQVLGHPNAGQEMTFNFGQLIAHAAKTRHLSAGTIIGSGTVSNRDPDGSPGRPVAQGGVGYSCLAELRMVEMIQQGEAKTPFLMPGDVVSIDMPAADGHSIFGRIEQRVLAP